MIRNRIAKHFEYRPPEPQKQPQDVRCKTSRMDWLEREDGPLGTRVAGFLASVAWWLAVTAGLFAAIWLIGYAGALGVRYGWGV